MNASHVERLVAKIGDQLLDTVPRVIAEMDMQDRLYAILFEYIHWDTGIEGAPPEVVPATVQVREEIMASHDFPDCVQWDAMYVSEICSGARLENDGPLSELCDQGFQMSSEEGFDHGLSHKMLRNVVKRLNTLDWTKLIDVTDDFIVCLQDGSGEHDNQQDFDLCVPAAKISLLRSRGFLWEW